MNPRFVPTWLLPAPDSLVGCAVRQGKSPWTEIVHLAWTAWIFLTPMFLPGGYDLRWALLTALSYPLFLLLYARCLLAPRHTAWRHALGMIVLATALLPVYPAGLNYFIFGCVMLHLQGRRNLVAYLAQVLLLNAAFVALAWWIGYPPQALVWLPVVSVIVGIIVHVERSNQERDLELKLSHEEVRRLAATAERERIGRDLHDLLGHTLSLITLKLELSRKLFERDPDTARRELEEAEGIARHALAEVRSAVTGIRAVDLAAELASARVLLESSNVHLDYAPPPAMPPATERALALVLREAVTNISRHAQAASARIAFTCRGDLLEVLIADDGRGGVTADGNGLAGMRERMAKLGGSLLIDSPRGQGTRLRLRLPMADASSARPASAVAGTAVAAAPPAAPVQARHPQPSRCA